MTDKYRLVLKGDPVSREEAEQIRKIATAAPAMLEALDKIQSWLLCAAITTPEDMAQSFPAMLKIVADAKAKAGAT